MTNGLDDARLERYARHVIMDEIGEQGQQQLADARVLLVGVGGLGCPCATYLASCGIGHMTLVDDDKVETSNLQRQTLFRDADVGLAKAKVAARELERIDPNIKLDASLERAGKDNLAELAAGASVVIDASDNFPTRLAVNQACHDMGKELVCGAAERFDGQVFTFGFSKNRSPCYGCVFPVKGDSPEPTPCALLGVFAPLTGLVGSIMAAEAVRLVCGLGGHEGLTSRMLALDMLDMRFVSMAITPSSECGVCARAR